MSLLLSSVTPDALTQFGGRLHPLVLHLPIGLLAAVVLVEIVAILRRKPLDHSVRITLVAMFAASAAFAMISGLLLSREDSYGGDALQTHKLLGIGVAIGASLMAFCAMSGAMKWAMKPALRRIYALLLVATTAAMIPAGHLGGTMTHGENFLTAPFSPPTSPTARTTQPPSQPQTRPADADGAPEPDIFASIIAPMLQDKCLACHNAARHKGGLSLETHEAMLAGSEAGLVIVPGDAASSELVIRLRLPLDDDAHMPPPSKPQPTEVEIAALEQWITAGAVLASSHNAATLIDVSTLAPAFAAVATLEPLPRVTASPPPEAIAALRAAQVHVEQVDPASGLLWIDFAAAATIDDAQALALLEPLRDCLADLSLAGTRTGDDILALVAAMPNLRSLNLSRTACSPAGLRSLQGHAALEDLRLTQTTLDDTAIESLAALPALQRVYLWSSGVSPEAAVRLRSMNAMLQVDVGASSKADPLETEPAIALSGEAPLPGAAPTSSSLKPINAFCPVSGAAVNPKFAIVHEGAVIGFCCQDCAAKFWAEPAKYALPK